MSSLEYIKNLIGPAIINYRGWSTSEKIIVFESDDWGTIRSSTEEYSNTILQKDEFNYDKYNRYDSLETNKDVEELFDVLLTHRNNRNEYPVFTANCIMGNPDFDKIESDNFNNYHYEIVTETFKKHPNSNRVFELWKKGLDLKIFTPQLHGREHINWRLWLANIKSYPVELELFRNKSIGYIIRGENDFYAKNSMAGLNYSNASEIEDIQMSINEGAQIFKNLFGFSSKSYIANNYIWDDIIEESWFDNGINYIQGQSKQLYTFYWRKKFGRNTKRRYLGEKNKFNQLYLVRNCSFEPCMNEHGEQEVEKCINQIKWAFKFNKPAIISTHRVNYIGAIEPINREKTLRLLELLLARILKDFPEIHFMSSDQLGDLILSSKR